LELLNHTIDTLCHSHSTLYRRAEAENLGSKLNMVDIIGGGARNDQHNQNDSKEDCTSNVTEEIVVEAKKIQKKKKQCKRVQLNVDNKILQDLVDADLEAAELP